MPASGGPNATDLRFLVATDFSIAAAWLEEPSGVISKVQARSVSDRS